MPSSLQETRFALSPMISPGLSFLRGRPETFVTRYAWPLRCLIAPTWVNVLKDGFQQRCAPRRRC